MLGGVAVAIVVALGAALVLQGRQRRMENDARVERERRLAGLGRMSSVLAHELRNPLASLKGHAQLLLESLPEGTKQRAKAERVVEEAERLERLTTDLLAFVRGGPAELRPMAVGALVSRIERAFAGDGLRVDVDDSAREIVADEARLAMALENVTRNALQASRPGDPAVELRVRCEPERVVVEVRDHGTGLPPGEEAQIFDSFVTHKTRGTGLGLVVARRAIEQHGGSIVALSCDDGGALFRIILPVDAGAA